MRTYSVDEKEYFKEKRIRLNSCTSSRFGMIPGISEVNQSVSENKHDLFLVFLYYQQ